MTRSSSVLGSVGILVLLAGLRTPLDGAAPQAGSAAGPLRVHPGNSRYFTDGSGKAVYLTGSHLWQNLRDIGPSDPPTVFDYTGYLNLLEANGHNFIRLWAWDLSRSKIDLGIPPFQGDQVVIHFPWPRTGPGNARDGKPKFDLGAFDPSYFNRLRSRVIAARDRGIYVSIMLFEGWGLHSAGAPWRWDGHPMHASNNVNGINGNPDGNGYGTEIQTLQIPAVTNIQKAYVRKVIDTVNDLDNVLYEITNESGNYSTSWQYDMINTIKTAEAGKPKQHPVGMTFQWSSLGAGNNANLFNSPADWISPNRSGGYRDNPPAANGSKVIIADTDHIDPWLTDLQWVWRSFLRGMNPIVMDHYDGPKWNAIRRAMGEARAYADRMDLAAMTPRNSLSSTAYCLADPGSEYLVYQPGTGAFDVDLQTGTYSYEWFNTVSGKIEGSGGVTASGGNRSFTPPFGNPAVLYLNSSAVPPPPPPTPTPGSGTGLTGEYYDTMDFSGAPLFRTDPRIDFSWGAGSPDPSIGPDTFSVRWTGLVEPQFSETVTFHARTDDGVRLWVDGRLLIDAWIDQAATEWSQSISLTAGQQVDLTMEYYENGGNTAAELRWSSPSIPKQLIPTTQFYIKDSDGDGVPDAEEIALGSDPNDPGSVPGGTPPPGPGPGPAGGPFGSEGREGCGATGIEAVLLLLLMRRVRARRLE